MPDPPPPPKHHIRDLIVALLIGVVAFAVTACWEHLGLFKPDHRGLFQQVFLRPPPESVQVLNATVSTHWSGSKEVWMHFRISPADLEKILQAEPYDNYGYGLRSDRDDKPGWWNAASLGAGKKGYGREIAPHFGCDHSTREFSVNEKGDEVVLLMRNWYDY